MKTVITDASTVCDENISLDEICGLGETEVYPLLTAEELKNKISDAEIIICNKTQMTAEVLSHAPRLKYIGLFATGFNNVDLDYCNTHGITVCNVPSYSTDAVAQHTFALMLALVNRVGEYDRLVEEGDWVKSRTFSFFPLPTLELCGKTLGIVGCGSIGKKVAEIAVAFGMRVLAVNRSRTENSMWTQTDFHEMLREADFVSMHCPLNAESEGMMNADAFARMKKGAYFINTARGALVDEEALRDALNSGHLAGAGLDVLREEPMTPECLLLGLENCLITPHIAWAGIETRRRLIKTVAENIKCFLDGKPQNTVK